MECVVRRSFLELLARGGKLESFFIKNGIRNIAIYGGGELGSLFVAYIERFDICVKLCIDRNYVDFYGIRSVDVSNLENKDIDNIDLIVICLHHSDREVIGKLSSITTCKTITLLELINISFYKDIVVKYCEQVEIKPYVISYPMYFDVANLSREEKILTAIIRDVLFGRENNPAYFEDIYKTIGEYSDEYIRNVYTQSPVVTRGRTMIHADIKSPYVNITNGVRFTHYAPDIYNATIHFIGHCDVLGYGADDSRTISSQLQKRLNSITDSKIKYRVLNHGVWGYYGNDVFRAYETLRSIPVQSGDIVIFIVDRIFCSRQYLFDYYRCMLNNNYSLYNNLQSDFDKPREMPLMIDYAHLSHYGMERVADCIFKIFLNENLQNINEHLDLAKDNSAVTKSDNETTFTPPETFAKSLDEYIEFLRNHKNIYCKNIGAIVMNCNPFTNGHRYLIEKASRQVDMLYIFVVEEDKSQFPFNDRMMLVKKGVDDLSNVTVLPSGRFIISSITFPEYFVKDSMKDVAIDATNDIEIFSKYIAPELNISTRFVGNEPLDPLTKQYNQLMKDILPKYGIKLIELERISVNNEVISASYVRRLLEERDFEKLSDFVPEVTLRYLKSNIEVNKK